MTPGKHIFRGKLSKQTLDFAPIRAAWSALSDGRVEGYSTALPAEWAAAAVEIAAATRLIKDARNHIDGCLAEVQRVLT